ncbi:MAG: HAMP domain-containing protein [Gemmatimonadetes bacterium]|nr:HAMP domain-containing protein [Gemmatimonadota bacterium]
MMVSRFSSVGSSLSVRLFAFLFLSVLLLFSVHVAISNRVQTRQMEQQVKADAYRASDFIRQSLLASMLRNEREHIYEMIGFLGAEPGVEVIRIYNKRGEIKFSSHAAETGSAVDLQAEACYVCHASVHPLEAVPSEERARVYRKNGSHRVLGLINPIHNNASCSNAACHAHTADQSVLGVLDVQMSLEALDRSLAATGQRTYALAVGIIFVSLLVMAGIVYRAVYRPVRQLRRGTEALARGDLDVEIRVDRQDELGVLAQSFNRMARNLQTADTELREWSHTLEDRVREKTAELEQIHQQMVLVEKAASMGKMAATVAHEINNPLSGIITYAKLSSRRLRALLPDGPEKQQVLDNLELIGSESMRCGNIVRDLLTYARASRAEFRPAHLHDLVTRALRLVAHHTALRGVQATSELELGDDEIVCDPDQIVQALVALLINAVEAMPDGGRLVVRTWAPPADGASVCVSVGDTGVGIPPGVRDRIFDPFFSTKTETKGVGLGLAVVYGIVQRHEGEIAVESAVGKGTTFTITIPRDPERVGGARAARGAEVAGP